MTGAAPADDVPAGPPSLPLASLPLASLPLVRAIAIVLAVEAVVYGAAFAFDGIGNALGAPYGMARYAVFDSLVRASRVVALVGLLRAIGRTRFAETRIFTVKTVDFGYAVAAVMASVVTSRVVRSVEGTFGLHARWWGWALFDDVTFGWPIVLFAVTGAVLNPIAEELTYRGLLLGPLASRFGRWPALILSSAVFAARHGSIALSPAYFIDGVILGLLVVRTNRLASSYLAHLALNGLIFAYDLGRLAHAPR